MEYNTEELKVVLNPEAPDQYVVFSGITHKTQVDLEEVTRKNAQGEVSFSTQLEWVFDLSKSFHNLPINGKIYVGDKPTREEMESFPLSFLTLLFAKFIEAYVATINSQTEEKAKKKK